MPRSFEVSAESPASVDQVHSAFGDEDYWQARLAVFGPGPGAATLDSLIVDAAGTVVVATTFSLLRDRLPRLVQQLGRGDLQMVHTETWSRANGNQVRGQVGIAVPGTPLSATGRALLEPLANGSRLQYSATVKVKVPLVGGQIESFMSSRLSEGIMDIQRFTTAWICENGRPAKLRRFGRSL
jgi:Protein of unknown function (DUF2505)